MGHGVSGFGTEFFGMEFRDGVLRVEGGGGPTHRGEAAMNGARSFAQSFGTEFRDGVWHQVSDGVSGWSSSGGGWRQAHSSR